jgi:hypothetical protein
MFALEAPQLSHAYADTYAIEAPRLEQAPTPEPAAYSDPLAADRFVRQKRLGQIGLVTMGAGLGAVIGGGFVILVTAASCIDFGGAGEEGPLCVPGLALGSVLVIGGTGAFLVGEGLMFAGGISAAYAGRELGLGTSPTVGWVGLGLTGASIVMGTASGVGLDDGTLAGLSGPVGLAGLICGIVQVANVGAASRRGAVVLAPSKNGVLVLASF